MRQSFEAGTRAKVDRVVTLAGLGGTAIGVMGGGIQALPTLASRVGNLFSGHPELLLGYNQSVDITKATVYPDTGPIPVTGQTSYEVIGHSLHYVQDISPMKLAAAIVLPLAVGAVLYGINQLRNRTNHPTPLEGLSIQHI